VGNHPGLPGPEPLVKVQNNGFRVDELILVTTMLDPEIYTKEELAELFLQRWNIELDLRSIKSVMQMDVLRCETPSMVEKEIWMHLLAYNLIRTLMARGAAAHRKEPRQLSFKGTMQTLGTFENRCYGPRVTAEPGFGRCCCRSSPPMRSVTAPIESSPERSSVVPNRTNSSTNPGRKHAIVC